jgi:hypothetical protein
LSRAELEELGVFWLKDGDAPAQDVFVTRLHAPYPKGQMRQDINFQATNNRDNLQGRYIMNQPFTGNVTSEAGEAYVQDMRRRLRKEALTVTGSTGWAPRVVESKIKASIPRSYW